MINKKIISYKFKEVNMKDFVNTMMNLGLGTLIVTKEKAEAIARELIKKGELNRNKAEKFVNALIKHGKQAKAEITAELTTAFKKTIGKFDFATKKETKELKREIEQLKKLLKQTKLD